MTLPRFLVVVAGLLFCFSSSAFATGISLDNSGGTLSTAGGLQLTGATLTFVTGLGSLYDGNVSGDITALNFSIGAPNTGSIASGSAKWTTGGGSFSFDDSKTGLMFNGTFTCSASLPCTWSESSLGSSSSGFFDAPFAGTLNGKPVTGLTAQINLGGGNDGVISATVVPEVGTLGLVGMGLLGMAGLTKRKWFTATKKAPG